MGLRPLLREVGPWTLPSLGTSVSWADFAFERAGVPELTLQAEGAPGSAHLQQGQGPRPEQAPSPRTPSPTAPAPVT